MKEPIKKITLKDGSVRYRLVVDIGRDENGKRKQLTRTFDTMREARDELSRVRHESNLGTYVKPSKERLNRHLDDYLKGATRGRRTSTKRNYADALRPVRDRLGDRPLQSITKADIEDLMDWMLTAGRPRGPRDRLHAAWRLPLYGLRRGEVLGLRWSDIDLKAKTLTVNQARVLVEYKVRIEPPNSRNGKRTLPLDDALVSALTLLRKCQMQESAELGYGVSGWP